MINSYFRESYDILCHIYKDRMYSNIALKNAYSHPQKNTILKIVNGVLENNFLLLHIIDDITNKTPRLSVKILLMQSIYCIVKLQMNANSIKTMSLAILEEIGKEKVSDFVSFALSKVVHGEYIIPNDSSQKSLEIQFNAPFWLIKMLKKDYPKAYKKILQSKTYDRVHIRLSSDKGQKEFEKRCNDYIKTLSGYFVQIDNAIKEYLDRGDAFVQSLTSTYAVMALGDVRDKDVLDVCSAPGGKSVFLASRGANVTACDIHPHRLELVKGYGQKAKVKLNVVEQDGIVFNPEWKNAYDCILVDAPCSGLGVTSKRADILLNRKEDDIAELCTLQHAIINNAARYLKRGGILVYSTCTVLKRENDDIIEKFLQENPDFILQKIEALPYNNNGTLQFIPNNEGLDGFYIARMVKK